MANKLVSVDENFELPPSVKATDANLPERLGETALSATYAPNKPFVKDVVADFGPIVQTSDQALKDAFFFAADNTDASIVSSNRVGKTVIEIPAGTYTITEAGALMKDLAKGRATGIVFKGAGANLTSIIFSPTTADAYLMENVDSWSVVAFEGITFHSTVASASFMSSRSDGGAQNYSFRNCRWTGTWKYGLDLKGTNNNSEISWYHCGIHGSWNAFLYSAATDTSDQFLNYNFFATNWETSAGNFIDMAKGGNINIWGGSIIDGSTNPNPSTFFKLRGGTHFRGVQRLLVIGARFEHRNVNSILIDCEWTRGNVSFISCDMDSQTSAAYSASSVYARFGAAGGTMPIVRFSDCTLPGKHRYHYGPNSWEFRKSVTYEHCEITNYPEAREFIEYVADGGTNNHGGRPAIAFEGSRGNGAGTNPFDTIVGWETSLEGNPQTRRLLMKNPAGILPASGGTLTAKLPLGSIITKVIFHKGIDGANATTGWAYSLKDADLVEVAAASGGGTVGWKDGFHQEASKYYVCDTENKRNLSLTNNVSTATNKGYVIVEYLA